MAEGKDGQLFLQRLNIEDIVDKLQVEMDNKDVDIIVKRIRKKVNEKVNRKHKDLFT